jgi:hypothetical protein
VVVVVEPRWEAVTFARGPSHREPGDFALYGYTGAGSGRGEVGSDHPSPLASWMSCVRPDHWSYLRKLGRVGVAARLLPGLAAR